MREFQRKRRIRKVLYSKGALLLVFVLLVLLARATWGVYAKERESAKNVSRVESNLSALQARGSKLKEDIGRLNTLEGIEGEIREQFQVAKPGERMVVLVEEQKDKEQEQVEERSMVSKFFDLFR